MFRALSVFCGTESPGDGSCDFVSSRRSPESRVARTPVHSGPARGAGWGSTLKPLSSPGLAPLPKPNWLSHQGPGRKSQGPPSRPGLSFPSCQWTQSALSAKGWLQRVRSGPIAPVSLKTASSLSLCQGCRAGRVTVLNGRWSSPPVPASSRQGRDPAEIHRET